MPLGHTAAGGGGRPGGQVSTGQARWGGEARPQVVQGKIKWRTVREMKQTDGAAGCNWMQLPAQTATGFQLAVNRMFLFFFRICFY